MSLYTISRLVRRGFTLGELSLATGSGISLALEFWRLTLTRVRYGWDCLLTLIVADIRIPLHS